MAASLVTLCVVLLVIVNLDVSKGNTTTNTTIVPDDQIYSDIICYSNIYKIAMHSQNSSKEYTWGEANAVCLSHQMVLPDQKLGVNDITCLQRRMRQLTASLASHIQIWTSTCGGQGDNKKCGLFFFDLYHTDGERDGYRPNVDIANKALQRVVLCLTDINECIKRPCPHDKICKNTIEGYNCQCAKGLSGLDCRSDTNECIGQPCPHGKICKNTIEGYNCQCAKGFTGLDCRTDVNECISEPCQHNGICKNTNGSFYCQCAKGWIGPDCRSEDPIYSDMICDFGTYKIAEVSLNSSKKYTWDEANAVCLSHQMVLLDQRLVVNDITCLQLKMRQLPATLASHLYIWTSSCSRHGDSKKCGLFIFNRYHTDGRKDRYQPNVDIANIAYQRIVLCLADANECISEPCQHSGTCSNTIGSFHCRCANGWTGPDCRSKLHNLEALPSKAIAGIVTGSIIILLFALTVFCKRKCSIQHQESKRYAVYKNDAVAEDSAAQLLSVTLPHEMKSRAFAAVETTVGLLSVTLPHEH